MFDYSISKYFNILHYLVFEHLKHVPWIILVYLKRKWNIIIKDESKHLW